MTGGLICSIAALALCAIFLFPPKDHFHNTYSSGILTLSEVNENLTMTQVTGEYPSIEKTYRKSGGRAVSFFFSQDRVQEETEILSCKISLIVDREYRQGTPEAYNQQSEYLGYTMYYRRAITTREFNI